MQRYRKLVLTSCLALGALAACQKPAPCPSDGVDFGQLFYQNYVEPFREGDAEKWANAFSEDAMALHNKRPADLGREGIAAFGRVVAQTFTFAQYDVSIDETRTYCDWALSRGQYASEFIFKQSGEPAPWGPTVGKFLIVWVFDETEGWKILADMGNSNQ